MQTSTRLVALTLGAVTAGAFALSGCNKPDLAGLSDHHGRYAGVGIYAPSVAWTKMLQDQPPGAAPAAKLADDQAIIVVTDSQTGELRACGDLSGYCVGMNPWRAGLAKSQAAPVNLNRQEGAAAAVNTSTTTASSVVR
jgi:hypothetical protein